MALAAPRELAELARGVASNVGENRLKQLAAEVIPAAERTLRYEVRVGPEPADNTAEQTDSMLGNVVNTFGRGLDNVVGFFKQ